MALALAESAAIPNPELCQQFGVRPHTVFVERAWLPLRGCAAPGAPIHFPPCRIATIKASAREPPTQLELPFSRISLSELESYLHAQKIAEHISIGKLWRVLKEDAIRPWYHRSHD